MTTREYMLLWKMANNAKHKQVREMGIKSLEALPKEHISFKIENIIIQFPNEGLWIVFKELFNSRNSDIVRFLYFFIAKDTKTLLELMTNIMIELQLDVKL